MKKGLLIITILLTIVLSLFLASAAVEDQLQQVSDKLEQGTNTVKNPQDIANEYLKQEWGKIMEKRMQNNSAGKAILAVHYFIKDKLNVVITKVLGYPYSLSWAFVFAVIIWLWFFLFFIHPLEAIFPDKSTAVIASAVVTALIGLSGIIKKAVDLLTFAINNVWIAVISFFLAVVIMVLLNKVGINVKQTINQSKENAKKEQTNKDREIIHAEAKVAKESLDSFSDGAGI